MLVIFYKKGTRQRFTENLKSLCEAFLFKSDLNGFLPDPIKSEKNQRHLKIYLKFSQNCDKYTEISDSEHRWCTICPSLTFLSATNKIAIQQAFVPRWNKWLVDQIQR